MKNGALDSKTKELIYIAVSITNSCEYCIRSHSFAAKKGSNRSNAKRNDRCCWYCESK